MPADDPAPQPPARLRRLVSWQAGRLTTLGARATGQRMAVTSRADFAVLAALDEYGEISQADLGRHLGLDRNNVTGILDRLSATERVRRVPDAADRRRNILVLTTAGRQHLAELQEAADDVQAELLAGLAPDQREVLIELLSTVLAVHGRQSA